jgi:hypothetical protein
MNATEHGSNKQRCRCGSARSATCANFSRGRGLLWAVLMPPYVTHRTAYIFKPAERAEPSDETVSGASSDAHFAIRSGAENRPAPVDRQDPQIAEKIKHRQVSLAVQYVAALRAR